MRDPLAVPLAVIEQRLASDVTTGVYEGVGLEHVTIVNDRPVDVVAREIMTFLGWP